MAYKIKETPADFQVKEILNPELSKQGEYTYFLLKKENWTTMRAITQIGRRLRVSKNRFGFAGNKDKHAITEQVVSVWKIEPEQLENIRIKDISIKVLGKGEERINLGGLTGNKFKIVVRALTKTQIERAKNRLPEIKKGFPNYFGEQRFGVSGNTHLIGKEIIDGDLEGAVRELLTKSGDNKEAKKFSTFAKKNWGDWKEILKRCPKFLGIEKAVLNWLVRIPTDFGGALREIPKPTRRIFVHAYQSYLWNKELKKGTNKEILEIPPIEIKRMPELNCLGTERKTIVKPKRLRIKFEKNTAVVSFELEKGTYATELLRVLFS